MTARAFPVLVFGLALLSATSALAQPPEESFGRGRRAGREEAGRMVDAYVVSHLQQSLGLSDEQFFKVLPPTKRLLDDRRRLHREKRRVLVGMREALGVTPVDERRVAAALRASKRVDAEVAEAERRNREAVDAVLTPIQQARFRILEVEVEQRIREMVRGRRSSGPPGRRTLDRE